MFFIAAVTTVVLLATIGNLLEHGNYHPPCKTHLWVDNTNENRNHYLMCSECKREPGEIL